MTLTFYEARDEFYRVYLRHVMSTHLTPTAAARFAEVNRTHLYQLCRRYGVPCGKPRAAYLRHEPPRVNAVACQFASLRG